MNKIYRTVYNETTGTWVAVCEIAKTHTKSSGSTVDNTTASVSGSLKARSLTAIAASLALLSPLAVSPAFAKPWDGGNGNDVTGSYSNASGQNNTVSGINSFASGKENTASGEYSTAVGDSNKAGGLNSVSLGGRNNQSTAHGSATLGGEKNKAGGEYSAIVGGHGNTATSQNAVAWGTHTIAGNANGGTVEWLREQFGVYNPDGTYNEEETVANACANLNNGTAANSCTGIKGDYNPNKNLQGVINYYNAEIYNPNDDKEPIKRLTLQERFSGGVPGKGKNATSWGKETLAGHDQATAFGEYSIANGETSTAFGKNSFAYADNSLAALGGQVGLDKQGPNKTAHSDTGVNSVAIGEKAWVRSDNAFALGKESLIDTGSANSVAIGSFSKVGPNATNSFAAVGGQAHNNNTIAIGARSEAYGEGSIAFGSGITSGNPAGAYSKGEGSIAIGKRAEAMGAQVHYDGDKGGVTLPQLSNEERQKRRLADPTGHEYSYKRTEDSAYASQMIAIGDNASAYGNQSIAIGGNSVASGYASIAIGGDDIGNLKNDSPTKTLTDYLTGELKNDLTGNALVVPSTITNLENNKPWVNLTTTKGHLSTAIGIKAVAEGDLSNAYGIAARSAGKNSNAFGTVSYAGGDESIAFGTAAETGNDANYSVALGYMSQVDGKNSAAVGQKNKVSKDNTFVLGNSVKGDLENSVYLGAGSTTKTSAARGSTQAFKSAEVGGVTYGSTLNENDTVNGAGFAGHTPVGIVSVGSVDDNGKISARRIQNVAAGAISEKSTDAINGSQLYAVLPKYTDDGKGNATSVTIGDKTYNLGGGADGNDNTVTELTVNGGNAPDNKTGNLKLTDTGKNGNHQYDVSLNDQVDLTDAGSLKVGGDQQDSPVTNVTAGNIDFGDQQGSVTNVASHLAPVDSTYNAGSDYTTSAPGNVLNTPVAVETARNKNDPVLSQAATVGDVINAGWNLQTNGQALDFVTHADTVNFKSSDNTIKVTGKYTEDNISEIDLSANIEFQKGGNAAQNGETADAVKLGDKTYKLGQSDGNDNTVTELTVNGGSVPGNKTGNLKLTDTGKNGNHKYDVSLNDQVDLTDAGSLKVGGDHKQDSPVTNVTAGNIDFGDQQGSVTNVKGHLGNVDSTYNAGNDHTLTAPTASLAGDGGTLDTPIAVEKFRNSNNPALNEAATLGDVLNAGWELRANGQEVDFITHADAINFKSSDNSISVTGEYDANNISNIDLKANVKLLKDGAEAKDGDTANAIKVGDNTYNLGDGGDANWNLTVDGGNATTAGGKRNLKDSDTIDVAQTGNDILFNVKTTPLTVNNGVVGKPAAPNSLVTAGDVQTAINNSGWFVNSGAVAGRGTNSGAAKTLVKAGEEVKFIAGDGMNIVQNGKEFTFNAKIVDSNGKQLTVDKDGNYVVSIVDPKGKPVTINSDGQYVVDGGSGNGNPFTITADDGSGKPSTTTIDGVEKTPGAGVAFVGDENTSVTKQETPNGTNVQVGLNDVVNVGGKPDANNPNKPVTIDGEKGNITFNGDKPVTVSNQDGNLSVGDTKVVNMKPGENPTDGVNVSQLLDTVGAASSSPATDENGKPITDNNGNSIGNVVSTTGSDGNTYTLKTYNVNGQGEYLTNNVVEAVSKMNEQGIKFFHVNDGNQEPVAQRYNDVDSQAAGKNAVAIGVGSIAKGENSIAIGTGNEVNGNNSGAFGDPSIINGNNSYSVGNNNTVATDNTFVLGNKVTNTAANSVFLGDESGQDAAGAGATGTVSSAKVGDIEYDGFAGASSNGMVSVGNATQVRRVSGVAAGEISETSTDAINGSQLHSALSNSGVYVTGNGAAPTDANLVKLGNKAGALNFVDGKGTTARVEGNKVTFDIVPGYAEGIEAGENVEFGYKPVVDQDGKPLYVDGKGGTTTDPNAAQKDADGNPIQQQTTVINAKQPDLRPLEQQVQQVENNSYAGVAQAMATAGLPQAYLPGKSMVAVAGGYYKGESGYALGVSTISDSGNWVFKATASGNSRNNYGGTVGAGYQW